MNLRSDTNAADNLNKRYCLAQSVATDAGAMALEMFRRRDQLVVEYKGLQDMVSEADRNVEGYIRRRVGESFPDDGFLGEEGGSDRDDAAFVWVVDPIDGTACFVNGMFSWCVSIAVVHRGEPVIGVVYDPNSGELFHARSGGGAYCRNKPIRVHSGCALKDGVLGVGTSFRVGTEAFVPFIESIMRDGGMFIRNGSGALMITYVAAGRLIGYFEPHMNSWDALAGLVLVREAGGVCNPFMENDGLRHGNPVLVANRDVYPLLARHAGMSEAGSA
ncbi:MAG: inositol monophosphatase family protein [Propionivibrio sp.]